MADPTIYVYGDIEMARQVIQGMNAILGSSPWKSFAPDPTNEYQGGGFFVFALMLTLWGAVLGWFIHQRFNLAPLILSFLIFVVMTVPKTDLAIEDVLSGASVIVGDTPVGIAVIASLGSTMAYRVAEKYNTQFTPLMASKSVMFDGGFVSPLRLMLALRKMVPRTHDPYFLGNMARYMKECAQRSVGAGLTDYNSASGKVYWLLAHPRASFATYKTTLNPQGTGMACASVGALLTGELDKYLGGTDPRQIAKKELNAALARPVGLAYGGMIPEWEWSDAVNAVRIGTGMDAAESRLFMADLLFHNWAASSMECGIAGDNYEFRECLSGMLEASEAAKVDTAMGASIFQKVMIPLMNILTYLFYGLSPIVIVIAVAMGIQGVGIILKYAFFGFWVQSWMPTAVFINYVTVEQIKNDLANFKVAWSDGALNISHFYDVVSTKLMVASDILAATPVITLAVLSGGAYAFTNLASAAGRAAAGKTDASSTAPKTRKVEPLSNFAGFNHSNHARNLRDKGPLGFAAYASTAVADPNASIQSFMGSSAATTNLSQARSAAQARTQGLTKRVTAGYGKMGRVMTSAEFSATATTTGGKNHTITGSDIKTVTNRAMEKLGVSDKTSEDTKNQIRGYLAGTANLGADGGLNTPEKRAKAIDKLLKNLKKLGINTQVQDVADFVKDYVESASHDRGVDLERMRQGTLNTADMAQFMRAASRSRNAAFRKASEETEQYQTQLEQSVAEQEELRDTAARMESLSRQTGGNLADQYYANAATGNLPRRDWSPFAFNAWLDRQGLPAEEALQIKRRFAENYDANLQWLARHDDTLLPKNQEDLAALKTWQDFRSFTHPGTMGAFSTKQGEQLRDYFGHGEQPDLRQDIWNGLKKGEALDGVDPTGRAGQILEEGGRNIGRDAEASARSIYTEADPSQLYGDGMTAALATSRNGASRAVAAFANNRASAEAKTRMGITRAAIFSNLSTTIVGKAAELNDWAKEWATAGVLTGGEMADANYQTKHQLMAIVQEARVKEMEEKVAALGAHMETLNASPVTTDVKQHEQAVYQELQNELTNARAYLQTLRETGETGAFDVRGFMQQSWRQEATLFGFSGDAKAKYVDTRQALSYGVDDDTLEWMRPQPSQYSRTQDYRAALAGYEAARVVGEYRDGTPGIDTWDKEQDQRLKTIIDQYHTGRPISPAGDDTGGTFFNPARLDPAPREP